MAEPQYNLIGRTVLSLDRLGFFVSPLVLRISQNIMDCMREPNQNTFCRRGCSIVDMRCHTDKRSLPT